MMELSWRLASGVLLSYLIYILRRERQETKRCAKSGAGLLRPRLLSFLEKSERRVQKREAPAHALPLLV